MVANYSEYTGADTESIGVTGGQNSNFGATKTGLRENTPQECV